MDNFIKHLQKTFRTDTKKGRAQFIYATYFLYWLVFYGVWFAPVFLSSSDSFTEVDNRNQGLLNDLFIIVQITAPLALVFVSVLIGKVIEITKLRLIIYSVIVFVVSVIYALCAVLVSIGQSYTGL